MMLQAQANEAPSSMTNPITVCCQGLKAGATITPDARVAQQRGQPLRGGRRSFSTNADSGMTQIGVA